MADEGQSGKDSNGDSDRLNPIVFYGSSIGLVGFAIWTILDTEAASEVINTVLSWISTQFGWFYFIAVLAYLIFVILIGVSRFGKIRLGPQHSRPAFPLLTWAAMLFSAGIGIDLLFFCVSEPVTQFLAPPVGDGKTEAAARHAMELTFLHWGLSGWGVYTLVGMSLAYFSYRQGLPLTVRSALYPIFGQRIYGPIGDGVDIAAVLGTIFGIATSLGIGMIQLNFGLNYMFGVPEGLITQVSLAVVIVIFAAISAATGVEKGIRRLSEGNMLLALILMLFVLFAGQTIFLLNALVANIGDYFSNFMRLSLNTYPYDPPTDWLNAWTVFFWAWWIAWGPFVGMFLARISRGRTIREFVVGTLTLPLLFMMAWMATMGNSAIDMLMTGVADFGEQAMNNPGSSIYLFLENLPWAEVTTIVATILAIIFFVTSGDSGSLVLANLTSTLKDPNADAPLWRRILWAAIIGVLTVALLLAGGLTALQSAVVIMGLPFAFVLFLMMFGLLRALNVERLKAESERASLSGYLSGRTTGGGYGPREWGHRLTRAMSLPTKQQVLRYMEQTVKPAMVEIKEALKEKGFSSAEIVEGEAGNEHLELNVDLEKEQNFTYQVWPSTATAPSFAMRPHQESSVYYRLEVHLQEGGQDYDLMDYTKEQVIANILDQWERHLHFLYAQRQASGGGAVLPDTTDKQTED